MAWNESFVDICLVLAVHFQTGQNLRTRISTSFSTTGGSTYMWAEPSQVFKPQELPQQTLYTPKMWIRLLIPSIFIPWCPFPLILSAFCRAFPLTTNHCQATDKAPHRRSCCDCQSWGGCTATHASDVCLRNWWCGWARPGQVGESLEVVNPVNPQEMEVSLKYGYP